MAKKAKTIDPEKYNKETYWDEFSQMFAKCLEDCARTTDCKLHRE